MGAAAFLPPIRSGDFLVADQERRLSCRRLGAATFLSPTGGQGGRSPHFTLSGLYTSRPLNRLTTQKSRRQESRLPRRRLEIAASQWATRKSPLQAGGKKAACPSGRLEIAPPSGRQESRPSQQATIRNRPSSGRQESRPSKSPLQRQLFRDGEPTPDNRAAAVSHSRLRTTFSGTGTRSISTAGASSISRTGLSTSMAR